MAVPSGSMPMSTRSSISPSRSVSGVSGAWRKERPANITRPIRSPWRRRANSASTPRATSSRLPGLKVGRLHAARDVQRDHDVAGPCCESPGRRAAAAVGPGPGSGARARRRAAPPAAGANGPAGWPGRHPGSASAGNPMRSARRHGAGGPTRASRTRVARRAAGGTRDQRTASAVSCQRRSSSRAVAEVRGGGDRTRAAAGELHQVGIVRSCDVNVLEDRLPQLGGMAHSSSLLVRSRAGISSAVPR